MKASAFANNSTESSLARGKPQYEKILEIGPIPPPRAGWGVRIEYVLDGMKAQGIQCAALDLGPNRKVRRDGCDGVRSGLDYAVKVPKYLFNGYRIHTHLNGESAKAYALVLYSTILSWLFRRPTVLTWHGGLGYRWFPDSGNRLVRCIHKTIYGLSEKIICNDNIIKKHIAMYGVDENKIVPIPAFSEQYLEFEQAEIPNNLKAFMQRTSPTFFCYVYFRPEFFLPVLVDALQQLAQEFPDFGIIIVGFREGSEETRKQLEQAGIDQHVFFAGDLSRNEFLTVLGKTDLCIRTHARDGVCSSVLEALSLGTPVVAADNPLRPAQVHTYPAEDADLLAETVRKVMALPPDQRKPAVPEIPNTVTQEIELLTGCER